MSRSGAGISQKLSYLVECFWGQIQWRTKHQSSARLHREAHSGLRSLYRNKMLGIA